MNRIKDYVTFTAWFAGLGYIVLWPMTAADLGGQPFGASVFCRDSPAAVLDALCNTERVLKMPAGLHVIGFLSAVYVTARLLWSGIKRSRRGAPASPVLLQEAQDSEAAPPRRSPPPPRSMVKPRAHFGLRGIQR
jgi:hypothetical protein